MSYSLDEAIADHETGVRGLQAVKERFPDAVLVTLPDGQHAWAHKDAQAVATDLGFHVEKNGTVHIIPYGVIEGVRVYVDHHWLTHHTVLSGMKEKTPELYRQLVAAVAGQ